MHNYPYSHTNKRYYTFDHYLKTNYHHKVAKVVLDLDFTCPNRDGTKGNGGCIFCSLRGSGDTSVPFDGDIVRQYLSNREVMIRKWPDAYTIPYFQSFTNTYGPLTKIKRYVEALIYRPEVVELSIATRADCLADDVLTYLSNMCNYKPIWLELGLQTSDDKIAEYINRGHDFTAFKEATKRLSKTPIKVCVHIINGLPFETREGMLRTVEDLKDIPYDAIKIHCLQILNGTKLADIYAKEPFKILTRDEYIQVVVDQLEHLRPDVIVERLTGDALKDELIAPSWSLNKTTILNDIDKEMVRRNTMQGKLYASSNL